jgi:tetratricopeptide (TPR) repeat protein
MVRAGTHKQAEVLGPRQRLLGLAFFVITFMVGWAPAADGDLFWHLAAGREMVATRSILYADPFSVSAAGRPWIDVHWLFQLGIFGVHAIAGLFGLVVVKCLIVAGSASILLAAVTRRGGMRVGVPFAVAFSLGLFAVRELLLVRPVIATLGFLALFFYLLERFRREGSRRLLVPLPLLAVLWANVQGLFALGAAVLLGYALAFTLSARFGQRSWFPFASESGSAERDQQRAQSLWWTAGLSLLASLATPYGIAALELPFRLLARLSPASTNAFSANIAENVSPFALGEDVAEQFFHVKWFLLLAAVSLLLPPRRFHASHVFLLLGFVSLALVANRNVLLLYWLGMPLLVLKLAPFLRWYTQIPRLRSMPRLALVAGYAALAGVATLAGTAAAAESSVARPTPFRMPEGSVRYIAAGGDERPVFAADNYGGYLIWQLTPRNRPYIDTRLILRTREEFEEYLAVLDEPRRFDAFERRFDFGYVALPTAYPDRYLGLIAHLYASPRWKLVFTDGTETLFARRASPADNGWDLAAPDTTDRVLSELSLRFGTKTELAGAARRQLARLQLVTGAVDEADRVLATTPGVEAEALRGRSLLARGDVAGAEKIGQRLLREQPNNRDVLNLLTMVALADGRPNEATRLLGRVLSDDPFDSEAKATLQRMEEGPYVEPR